jgi:hypothetical protein
MTSEAAKKAWATRKRLHGKSGNKAKKGRPTSGRLLTEVEWNASIKMHRGEGQTGKTYRSYKDYLEFWKEKGR